MKGSGKLAVTKKIVNKGENGFTLVVNQQGEVIPLYRDMILTFEDFQGARVKVMATEEAVTCEAELPESAGKYLWYFNPDEDNKISAENLTELISDCRIALNGRL